MPSLFVTEEASLYQELERSADQFRLMQQSLTADQARSVADLAGAYPGTPSGVLTGMGLAGMAPDMPLAEEIGRRSAENLLADPMAGLQEGQPVNGAQLRRQLEAAEPSGAVEPDAHLSFGEVPWNQKPGRALSNTFGAFVRGTEGAFEGAAQEASNLITSAAQAVYDDDDDSIFGEFAENFAGQDSFYRQAYTETRDRLNEGLRPWEREFYEGAEELVGSGLTVGGSFLEDVRESDRDLTLPGHNNVHYTPGRAVVQPFVELGVTEPGSRAYQTVSGALDFANRIFLDPANLVLPGSTVARRGLKADEIADFLPDATRMTEELSRSLLRGPRRTVNINGAASALTGGSRAGRRMVNELSGLVDDLRSNPDVTDNQLRGLLRRNTGGKLPSSMVNELAEVESAEDVIRILRGGLNEVEVRNLSAGRVPRFFRNLKAEGAGPIGARPFNLMPTGRPVNANRIDDATEEVDRWLGNMEMPSGERDELVGRLMRLDGQEDRVLRDEEFANVLIEAGGAATRHLANNMNLDAQTAERLTRVTNAMAKGDTADFRAFLTDELGREIPSPGGYIRERIVDPDSGKEVWKKRRLREGEIPLLVQAGDDAAPMVEILPTARTLMQHAGDGVFLPDAKAIRENLSMVGRMGVSGSTLVSVLRNIVQPMWVASTLGRPALAVRVIAENQMRMAFHGLDSAFRHPISYISWALGKKGSKPIIDDDWRQLQDQYNTMSTFGELRSGRSGSMPGTVATRDFKPIRRGEERFTGAWARRFHHFARTQEAQKVAELSREDAIEWFWRGEGQAVRRRLNEGSLDGALSSREAVGDYVDAIEIQLRAITGGRTIDNGRGIAIRVDTDNLGNQELYDAIATGRLRDVDITGAGPQGDQLRHIYGALDEIDDANMMPEVVPGPREGDGFFSNKDDIGENALKKMDNAFSQFFDFILSRREDSLTRNPAFNQMYWDRIAEQATFMSDDLLDRVVREAESAGLDSRWTQFRRRFPGQRDHDVVGELKSARSSVREGRWDDVEALNTYAAAHAADDMKSLLYDFANRSNFGDAMKLIAPFGEAWRDVLTTWARIGTSNPVGVVRRGTQTLRAGRDSNPLDLLPGGDGDPSDEGFFYTNDQGEEVFAYPNFSIGGALAFSGGAIAGAAQGGIGRTIGRMAAGALPGGRAARAGAAIGGALSGRVAQGAAALTGAGIGAMQGYNAGQANNENAEVAFTGRLSGMNLVAGQMLPGVGPVVQVPASLLIEEGDDSSLPARLLLPFGAQSPAEAAVPPWIDKLYDGLRGDPDSDRRLGNIVIDVARVLRASGDYTNTAGLTDRESETRLHEDAVKMARSLMLVRGAAQSTLPTGPEMEFRARLPNGEQFFTFNAVANEYRERVSETDPDTAMREFIDLFGVDLVSVLQGKSVSIRERSLDPVGADWERDNPELVDAYPNTIGFFAPESGIGFDFGAYQQSIARGDRRKLTPQENSYMVNNQLATSIYYAQRDKLGEVAKTSEGRMYLAELRASLRVEYPGYGQTEGLGGRIDTQGAIAELENAVADARFTGNGVARAAADYMEYRADAIEQLRAMGFVGGESLQSATSPEVVAIRRALRERGLELAEREPRFAGLWRGVLDRELRNDDDVVVVNENVIPLARNGVAGLAISGGVSVE